MDRQGLVEHLEEYFRRRPQGVAAVYLYGSRARGTARAGDLEALVAAVRKQMLA